MAEPGDMDLIGMVAEYNTRCGVGLLSMSLMAGYLRTVAEGCFLG